MGVRLAARILPVLATVAVGVFGAGCVAEAPDPDGQATAPSVTQPGGTASATTRLGGSLPVGEPYEFTSDGFRYTFALGPFVLTPELPALPGVVLRGDVAKPGETFIAFTGVVTNLQEDRRAPFPLWTGWRRSPEGQPMIAVPGAKVPGGGDFGDYTCPTDLPDQCVYDGAYACTRQVSAGTVTPIRSTDLLEPGESVNIGCYTMTEVRELESSEVRLYYLSDGGRRDEFDQPPP